MSKTSDWQGFYASEAKSYDARRYGGRYGAAFRKAHRDALQAVLQRSSAALAIDVGSGTGQCIPPLIATHEFTVACDLTHAMLMHSPARGDECVSQVQSNAFALPFCDSVADTVTSSRFLHLFSREEHDALLREMQRVAKPNAVIVVDYYNATARKMLAPWIALYRLLFRRRPEHDTRYSIAEAKEIALRHGFRVDGVALIGTYLATPFLLLPLGLRVRCMQALNRLSPQFCDQFLLILRKS